MREADYGIHEEPERGRMDKVITESCEQIVRVGGYVQKFIDNKSRGYDGFGEVYFSHLEGCLDRGWKYHKVATSNLTVVVGYLEIVVASSDFGWSRFYQIGNNSRICIPPYYWYRFKSKGKLTIICNMLNVSFEEEKRVRLSQSFEAETPSQEVDWSNHRLLRIKK